ncbi:4-oxalomesaconate hydratase [Acrocarpospora pleiomorpha]|uniref:4-oxalomesaconate hydratase n=1 Tax=Acrocarpospora pleiomorpha TaxID=90975 RepID=A0A5M3XHF4_9ACTN|nr:amidohydrolase family protein [Acrocarpospora pleiomorpha]GES19091.1 4-oxalomesaconate hydratase [Acrocarpospora pleiomorpha]
MVIDAHAHLNAPEVFYAYKARLQSSGGHHRGDPKISDEALAAAAARNVAALDEVGTTMQLISPRPYQLMSSARPERVVHWWVEANNDLIRRSVDLHPDRLAGVAALPVCAGRPVEEALAELDRVAAMPQFVGVCLNPDPSEGAGTTPPLGGAYWYPLFERLVAHDLPALVHSAGCFNERETYSEHFITEESIAILTVLRSDTLADFPELKLIIAHGGGSVPYQIGRWQAERLMPSLGGSPGAERFEVSLRRLWFDTVLHNPASLRLLLETVGPDRCLFGTERPGSGSVADPRTGRHLDDIKPVIDAMPGLSEGEKQLVFEGNARKVFSRLPC